MRSRWHITALFVVIAAAAFGIATVIARPAPDHAWFSAGKPGPLVIAHRGGAGLRPENTLAAFSHAAAIGADVLEMDVRATADGAIVCMHDATVDRTTDGHGRVDSFTLTELRKLDAGHNWSGDGGRSFPFRGKDIRVPALEEVFARFPATRMIIEIKDAGISLAPPLCALIRRYGMTEKALVASRIEDAVTAFREACPEVATSASRREAWTFFGLHLARLEAVHSPRVPGLFIPDRLGDSIIPTRRLVDAAHRRNLKVHVWTISDEGRMRQLIQIGVDGIITDRPDRLLNLLRRPGA